MRSWKFLLPLLASSLCFASQPDRITGPIDSSQMVMLRNHVSPMAQSKLEKGPIEPGYSLNITMLFTPTAAQEAALQKLLAEQQNPRSANFHKWLTPEQYADRFGLSQNDVDKVRSWLESQGFKVVYVARGRDSVTFSGNAAQTQSVFRTEIHRYEVGGKTHFANSTPPMIPAALSGIVGGFRGLHNFFPHPRLKRHPDYSISIPGQGTFTFLAPGDIATIYDINPLYQLSPAIDGTNQKMVIVGQTDLYLADLNDFRGDFGLPVIPSSGTSCAPSTVAGEVGVITAPCDTTNFEYIVAMGGDPGLSPGDLGESDLDIEWSGSVARNAQIIFVTSALGVDDSASYAIDNTLAPVISESYGLCEALNTAPSITTQDSMYQKAASEGISFFAAAGDEAAATCDGDTYSTLVESATLGVSVSYPASSPEVTAVGGTEFNEGTNASTYWAPPPTTSTTNYGTSALSYIPELAWNDTNLSVTQGANGAGLDGTGGGPSNCVNSSGSTAVTIDGNPFTFNVCDAPPTGGFAKPAYQSSLTPSDGVRDVPDISFSASNYNDPYIVCTPQSEVSNTSSSTSTCVTSINDAITTYNSAFGGTSAPTPVAAAMTVLLNQYLGISGLGNINTQLYTLYGPSGTSVPAFNDITTGTSTVGTEDTSNNTVPCTSGTPTFEPVALRCPTTGTLSFGYSVAGGHAYSSVTGLGSIDINALAMAWKASLAPDFQLTAGALSPATVPAGQQTSSTLTIAPITGSTGTVVNFSPSSCTGLPTGATCSFNPASVTFDGTDPATTVVTISTLGNMALPTGAQTITITPTNSPNTTTNVSLTVTATNQTFSLSSTASTYSVAPGATASVPITIAGTNGFVIASSNTTALPLTYTCTQSSLPSEASCSFSPTNGQAVSATSLTLSILTTAPTAQLRTPMERHSPILYALLLPGLFGMVFLVGSRTRGARLLSLIVVLGFSTLWLGSCSSGGGNNTQKSGGTPAGTYAIVVNATTGGAVPLTGSFTVNLTVQ